MFQAFVFFEFEGRFSIPFDRATTPCLPTLELYKSNLKLFFTPGTRVKAMSLIIDAINKGYEIKVRDFYEMTTFRETKITPHTVEVTRGYTIPTWMDRIVLDCDG